MEELFTIKHQDRNVIKEVKSGKIRFHRTDGVWHVGLEMRTFGDFSLDDSSEWNEEDYITIHLQDYPVGEEDPRTKEELEFTVPCGFDVTEGRTGPISTSESISRRTTTGSGFGN